MSETKSDSKTIGIDIGGANIKLADGNAFARHQPFALWQQPDELENQLRDLLSESPNHQRVAVTMTGELTDCFANKQQGVHFICDAIERASKSPAWIYLLDGRFVKPAIAKK